MNDFTYYTIAIFAIPFLVAFIAAIVIERACP